MKLLVLAIKTSKEANRAIAKSCCRSNNKLLRTTLWASLSKVCVRQVKRVKLDTIYALKWTWLGTKNVPDHAHTFAKLILKRHKRIIKDFSSRLKLFLLAQKTHKVCWNIYLSYILFEDKKEESFSPTSELGVYTHLWWRWARNSSFVVDHSGELANSISLRDSWEGEIFTIV